MRASHNIVEVVVSGEPFEVVVVVSGEPFEVIVVVSEELVRLVASVPFGSSGHRF